MQVINGWSMVHAPTTPELKKKFYRKKHILPSKKDKP